MAPQNKNDLSFRPGRDVPGYSDAFLRACGLTEWHFAFYRLLCRLCPHGETRLLLPQKGHLVVELMRAAASAGEPLDGLTKSGVDRKLSYLESDRAHVIETRYEADGFAIHFIEPAKKEPAARRPPKLRHVDSGDRQGQLFGEQERDATPLRVFSGDDEPKKPEPGPGFRNPGPGSVKQETRARVRVSENGDTSYTRAHVTRALDLDLGLKIELEKNEINVVKDACRSLAERWRAKRIIPDGRIDPRNTDMLLRAHILARYVCSSAWLQDALDATEAKRPKKPFGYLRTCLRRSAADLGHNFDALLEVVPLFEVDPARNGETS